MKKLISVSLSFILIICSVFAFNVTAFANSKTKATPLVLDQTFSASASNEEDEDVSYYWFKFDCTVSNYYEIVTSLPQVGVGDLILTVYEADTSKTVDLDVLNSPSTEKVTATYLEAGKSYYYRYEVTASTLDFNATLRLHNHSFTTIDHTLAVADDDSEKLLDGWLKYICPVCSEQYVSQIYTAPASAAVSGENFAYTSMPITPQINVYDRNGNAVSPSNYVVTYEDNLLPGKAYAYINFIGADMRGELTTSFDILPAKQTIETLQTKKSKQLTVNWTADTSVSGYEIQYGTSSKFYKSKTKSVIVTKNSTSSKTFSKLKSKKKYYVRIRAYKTIDSVNRFGSWSDKMYIKTK